MKNNKKAWFNRIMLFFANSLKSKNRSALKCNERFFWCNFFVPIFWKFLFCSHPEYICQVPLSWKAFPGLGL